MNEIKRIHIAKVPFNIELAAKKTFDTYLQALEAAVHDTEVMMDIELRMAEILSERGVKADGVIVADDVTAIIQQLGQPEEFADESVPESVAQGMSHRLFRDPHKGMIGGVASGIAAFAGINVAWVRLLLLIALLASFGTAVLIYIVLWIVIPPVRSASDRLQLEGKPVTIPGLQQVNEMFGQLPNGREQYILQGLLWLVGVGSVLAALAVLAATALGGWHFWHYAWFEQYLFGGLATPLVRAAFSLFVLSGLLLSALATVVAYAAFARRLTKRVVVAGSTITVLGLLAFGLAVATTYQAARQQDGYMAQHTTSTTINVDGDLRTATAMTIDAPGATLRYVASTETPKVTLRAFSDSQHRAPQPTVTVKDGLVLVTMKGVLSHTGCFNFMNCGQYELTMTGPALGEVTVKDGWTTYVSLTQPALRATLADNQALQLEGGTIGQLTVLADRGSSLDGSAATIDQVLLTNQATSAVRLGTVKDLSISNSQSCPAYEDSSVSVSGISGVLKINGQLRAVGSVQDPCLELELPDQDVS